MQPESIPPCYNFLFKTSILRIITYVSRIYVVEIPHPSLGRTPIGIHHPPSIKLVRPNERRLPRPALLPRVPVRDRVRSLRAPAAGGVVRFVPCRRAAARCWLLRHDRRQDTRLGLGAPRPTRRFRLAVIQGYPRRHRGFPHVRVSAAVAAVCEEEQRDACEDHCGRR